MCNAVPVFEAKNRLPFYIHLAETDGPVPIMRRSREVAYIISKDEYDTLARNAPKEKTLFERIQERRNEYGLADDDFDFGGHLEGVRETGYYGRAGLEHLFDDREAAAEEK